MTKPGNGEREAPRRILIAGGNSGIGLEAARSLVARGDDVTILGRSREKGRLALDELRSGPGSARFVQGDLSTHDGVRRAAAELLDQHERLDAVVHTTGTLMLRDERTADGLHPMVAVCYLSRYHLTQLLLQALRKSERPKVIMMTAKVDPATPIDYAQFPDYSPFSFTKMRLPIQVANHHYAAHLAAGEDWIAAAVINPGSADTDIMREAPRGDAGGHEAVRPPGAEHGGGVCAQRHQGRRGLRVVGRGVLAQTWQVRHPGAHRPRPGRHRRDDAPVGRARRRVTRAGGMPRFMITTSDFRYVDPHRLWRFTREQTEMMLHQLWPDEGAAFLAQLDRWYPARDQP